MKKVTLFAAAAAVSALVATPVLAQDTAKPRSGAHMKTGMKHQARAQNRGVNRDRMAYRRNVNQGNLDRRDTGFVPGAVAGGIVGGAVGTAGAITAGAVNTAGAVATAPFGGPYYSGARGYPYGNRYGGSYAASFETQGWNDGTDYDYKGVAIPGSSNYHARNGFTCRPGTVIKMGDQNMTCQ